MIKLYNTIVFIDYRQKKNHKIKANSQNKIIIFL